MESKITEKYLDIMSRFEKLTNEKNKIDVTKIKKKCDVLYEEVSKYIKDGLMKKTEIECFNWFDIFIKIYENEKDAQLSKILAKNDSKNKNKVSKDYIITQNNKRIYKIISKPIKYINETVDYDYDPKYSIFDQIDNFYDDAVNMENFPYKEGITELCMIFIDTPCDEIINEAKNKNINCISLDDLPLKSIENNEYINIDINVIIALCSDINFLDPSSDHIRKLINNKIFVGFNIENTMSMSNEEYCKYIEKEYNYLFKEIQKYKKVVMCQSAYNETIRILNTCGTETEKNRLEKIMKDFNIEIVDESDVQYKCDLITNNSKNYKKTYNSVEQDVIRIGYVLNAITFTSNHRYIEFLLTRNIFVEALISPSLNLICQVDKKKGCKHDE
jgi:hypothetical protein